MSSSSQRSSELARGTLCATANNNPTSFAPLHRTEELENLHDQANDQAISSTPTTATKKILTKCFTVIGDGSDKPI